MSKELRVYCPTMARFNAALEAGEIDNTQEVYVAEIASLWKNGEFYPYVYLDDYLKKTDAVALAKDLTGVLEATPEEFVFRASAGTKSIRDESAVIRRIKGNTSVWAQHADNPIFANGTSKWNRINTTLSIDTDGSLKVKHDTDGSQGFSQMFDDRPIPSGHKILVVIDYKRSASTSKDLLVYLRKESHTGFDIGRTTVSSASRRTDGIIITTTEPSDAVNIYPFIGGAVEDYTNVYSVNIFDLTALYEAGNEPTTLEEFKKTYPERYYPYCAPEVRSMRATGIETIGFNAFNGEYAEVLGGMQYCLCGDFTSVGFSDTIGGAITEIAIPEDKIYVPSRKGYIYASGSNICIHLVHSGVCNGEYHDYWKSVRMLPDIATYFPDGMHGIGGVFDEINEESAVKRLGVVDLGTLEWTEYTLNELQYWWATIGDIKMLGIEYFPNMTCSKLSAQTLSNVFTGEFDNSIAPHNSLPRVYARSSAYTDAASFKAAMSGVMLVYEIFEPVVTPITEPLQLDYKVADFGTEKMLNDLPSSPFRADVVYQFNAADRIRDNARNIERLEEYTKNMATMEDVINAIPTEVATATQRRIKETNEALLLLLPNILYDYSLDTVAELEVPPLAEGDIDYDNVWLVRCALSSSNNLSIPYSVMWKDGVAPSFSSWCIVDLTFRKTPSDTIIGEWKIYR